MITGLIIGYCLGHLCCLLIIYFSEQNLGDPIDFDDKRKHESNFICEFCQDVYENKYLVKCDECGTKLCKDCAYIFVDKYYDPGYTCPTCLKEKQKRLME